jgi:pimeloyl-ACP methyl ester carboxylesterase
MPKMIKYAKFRGIKVRYADSGKGKTLVLLHGFLESLEIFEELIKELSKQCRVISIDLPGHGKTPVIGYTHSMELMAACVKAVLDTTSEKKYVIAGHSMGGYVALAFAQLYPESLTGLCLFHSTALPDSEERKQERDRVITVVMNNRIQFIADLVPKLFSTDNRDVLSPKIEKAIQLALQTPKEGIVAAITGMKMRPNRELVLKKANYPVLFIIGKKDTLLAWENLLLLASLPNDSTQFVLETAGHMGFYEAPEECIHALKSFMEKKSIG